MKQGNGFRVLVSASVLAVGAFAGQACVLPQGVALPGYFNGAIPAQQGIVYAQSQQPLSVYGQPQQAYVQQPPPQPIVMGNPQDTYQAAQRRAQQYAAGMNPPVSAYQNQYFPAGYVMGSGAPTWSPSQAWANGYVIP